MTIDKIKNKCLKLIRDQFNENGRNDYEGFRRVFNKWFDQSIKTGRLHNAILSAFDNDLTIAYREQQKTNDPDRTTETIQKDK